MDDSGWLRRVVLRKANQHDVKVAPVLLDGLSYTVATGDKGYISKELKQSVASSAVDLVTPKRKNQAPLSLREKRLLKHHKQVESTFSNLDLLGLNIRRYRKPWGTVFHLISVLLADFLNRLFQAFPSFALPLGFLSLLFRIGVPKVRLIDEGSCIFADPGTAHGGIPPLASHPPEQNPPARDNGS